MAELKKNTMNQILFVMVDGTDFATIESTLGAASVAGRFYGVNHGGSVAMTSGALSKACSLVHSGIFRQTLKATECNYDYVAYRFTATGCADQVMAFQMVDYTTGNLASQALLTKSMVSDAHSAAAQANSRVLLNQSGISDIYSNLAAGVLVGASSISDIGSRVWADAIGSDVNSKVGKLASRITKAVAYNSQLSDLASDLRSYLTGLSDTLSKVYVVDTQANSRLLVAQSFLSDIRSNVSDLQSVCTVTGIQLNASSLSDIRSAIGAITVTIGASDVSDIASALLAAATFSDMYSKVGKLASRVPKMAATASGLEAAYSDVLSNLATTATASDIGSAIWAQHYAAHGIASSFGSLFRVGMSNVSDIQSSIDSSFSNLLSTILSPGVQLNPSSMSDLRSAITAANSDIRSVVSALKNLTVSTISDIGSRVWGELVAAHAGAGTFGSRFNAIASNVSDIQSSVDSSFSNLLSDLHSLITTTGVPLDASTLSDLRSAITAAGGGTGATASQVWGYATRTLTSVAATVSASDISDIASAVWANAIASDMNSKVGKLASRVTKPVATNSQLSDLHSNLGAYLAGISSVDSNIYSLLSDIQSDFQSRVPKAVATNSQLSDLASDLKSYLAGMSDQISNVDSALSSEFTILSSRVPKVMASSSQVSDLASDLKSYLVGMSDAISNIDSALSSQFTANVASFSDIRSAIDESYSNLLSQTSDLHSDLKSYLTGMSGMLSDVQSDVQNVTNALVNKQVIEKATGTVTLYDDVGNFVGTVPTAYTSTASDVTRKRLVP